MPRPRSQGIVIALLFGTLALILYGSLYPFDLSAESSGKSIGAAVREISWARAGRGDRVANVLLYAPLGFCLMLWLYGRVHRIVALAATVTCGVALSFAIEVTQAFVALRVPSWWDVVLNSAGTIVGAIAGVTWHTLGGKMRSVGAQGASSDRSAFVVLALWLVWRFAPFVPQFTLSKLKATFSPLANPYFSTIGTMHYWIWWTLLAQIVFAATSAQRGTEALLALIAVVLTSCIVIAGHTFVPSELLALLLLLPTLYVFDRLTPTPRRALLSLAMIGLFLYDSFAPFHRATHTGTFDPWPFMGWIDAGLPIDWEWIARRACYFAALVWVLREVGFSFRMLVFLIPLSALAIEIVQIWVSGQRSSITEPALALLVVGAMRALDGWSAIRQRAHSR